jgi:hypothetical protein
MRTSKVKFVFKLEEDARPANARLRKVGPCGPSDTSQIWATLGGTVWSREKEREA